MTSSRVLLAIDLNAFYAQCAVKADASLRGQPIGILQRSFVTTTSHEARALGALKCGGVTEVLKSCPQLKLVQQNMQLYRNESVAIQQLLAAFFQRRSSDSVVVVIERTGIDEFLADVTPLCTGVAADTVPSVPAGVWLFGHDAVDLLQATAGAVPRVLCADDILCLAAAQIACDLAAELLARLRFTVSIGVALSSRTVVKQAASVKKPAAITVCLPGRAAELLANVPLKAIAGIGSKLRAKLATLGCSTCGELRERVSLPQLTEAVGDADTAATLFAVVRGADAEPLTASELEPATVSAESFARNIKGARAFYVFLAALAEQLASRLLCDRDMFRRVATTFALRVRFTETEDGAFRDVKLLSRAISTASYASAGQTSLAQALLRNAATVLRTGGAPPMSAFLAGNCRAASPVIRGIGLAASTFVQLQSRDIESFFGRASAAAGDDDVLDAVELEDHVRDVFANPDEFDVQALPSFRDWRWSEPDLAFRETTVVADDKAATATASSTSRARPLDIVMCERCAARFNTADELALHADWHVAMDLRDGDRVAPPPAKKAATPVKRVGALDAFFKKS